MTAPLGREVDAIVVGGGLAGLAATHRLAANGLSVTLVEKRERLGGSSAMSGGWFALSGTAIQRRAGVEDSDALFVADMVETGGGFADERLLQALVERQAHAVAAIDRAAAWTDELKVSAGMTVARAHLIRIRDLLAFLEHEARRRGRRDPAHRHAADGLVLGRSAGCRHPIRARGPRRARRRRPHERRVLPLPRASRALRARPGRRHALRRDRQHRRRTSDGLDAGGRAWPTSGMSPAPTASMPIPPTTSTSC